MNKNLHENKELFEAFTSATNRSKGQTHFLFDLLDQDFDKLVELEKRIRTNMIGYCPGDVEECDRVLSLDIVDKYLGTFLSEFTESDEMLKEIKFVAELETLHRYIFDKLYSQYHDIDDSEKLKIDEYNRLFALYPDFRTKCAEFLIILSGEYDTLSVAGKLLCEQLYKINYKRYWLDPILDKKVENIKGLFKNI